MGLAGIALATAMVFSGCVAISSSLTGWIARGVGDHGRAITVVAFSGLVLFAAFFAAAIANVRRSDYHKRFMVLATVAIMQAAVGRVAFYAVVGRSMPYSRPGMVDPASPAVLIAPNLVFDVLVLGTIVAHDWRRRRRIHPAYPV